MVGTIYRKAGDNASRRRLMSGNWKI